MDLGKKVVVSRRLLWLCRTSRPSRNILTPTFPDHRLTIASNLSLLCISVGATIYSSGIAQLSTAYGVSIEVATLGVSVYQLGFAFGPLVWVSQRAPAWI